MTSALRITRNTPRIAPPMRLFAALALAGSLTAAAKPPAAPSPFAAVVETEVPAIMKTANIKGAAVGLIVDGRLVYAKGFGYADHAGSIPVTPDTVLISRFRCATTSNGRRRR